MVKVQKRDKTWENYLESKVEEGVRLAGATSAEASRVAKEVTKKVGKKAEIKAEELSEMVLASLDKVNKVAAKEFRRYRAEKLGKKKSK